MSHPLTPQPRLQSRVPHLDVEQYRMNALRIPLILTCLLAVYALAGCSSKPIFSRDPEEAKREIAKIVPVGTNEQEAEQLLKNNGLECSRLVSEGAINHLLVGTQKRGATMWQFGLSITNGKVNGYSVTVSGPSVSKVPTNSTIPESWYKSWLDAPWRRHPKVIAEFQLNTGESRSFTIQTATKREIGFIVKDYTKADGDKLVYLQSPDGINRVGALPGASGTFTPVDGTISVVVENRNPMNTRVVLYHEDVEQPGAAQPATQPADKPPVKDQPPTPTSKDAPR